MTNQLQPFPLVRGKANKQEILRRLILQERNEQGYLDRDKVLSLARKIMAQYPSEQQVELTRRDIGNAQRAIKRGNLEVAALDVDSMASTRKPQVQAEAFRFSKEEYLAARAFLKVTSNVSKAIELLELLGEETP